MGKPTLNQLARAAHDPAAADTGLGPRRAVIQCRHQSGWWTVAHVRGHYVVVGGIKYDLRRSSHDIWVRCDRCPGPSGRRVLDIAKVRAALARGHGLKLDVDEVSREPRDGR